MEPLSSTMPRLRRLRRLQAHVDRTVAPVAGTGYVLSRARSLVSSSSSSRLSSLVSRLSSPSLVSHFLSPSPFPFPSPSPSPSPFPSPPLSLSQAVPACPSRKDPYEVLGVPRNADEATLKRAYRKLAVRHHPDKNPGNTEEAEKRFKEIGESYAVRAHSNKKTLPSASRLQSSEAGYSCVTRSCRTQTAARHSTGLAGLAWTQRGLVAVDQVPEDLAVC